MLSKIPVIIMELEAEINLAQSHEVDPTIQRDEAAFKAYERRGYLKALRYAISVLQKHVGEAVEDNDNE